MKHCIRRILSLAVIFTITLSVASFSLLSAQSVVLKQETNPTDMQFKVYDSSYGNANNYTPEGQYSQPTPDSYRIRTNAYLMWWNSDDIAFLYKNYRQDYGADSSLTVEATFTDMKAEDGEALFYTASEGVCIRDSDSADAAQIFLHVRGQWIGVVYRTEAGTATRVLNQRLTPRGFPLSLKIEKTGKAFACYYKYADDSSYQKLATIYISMGNNVLAGVAAHASDDSGTRYIISDFKDLNFTVEGPEGAIYEEGDGTSSEKPDETPVYPDPPVDEDMLLRETFTDNSMLGEGTVEDPDWTAYSENSDVDSAKIEYADYNRYWRRSGEDSVYFIGDHSWTDYSLSVDVKFDEEINLEQSNSVYFYVRFNNPNMYGYSYFRITLSQGNTVSLHKCVFGTQVPSSPLDYLVASATYDYLKYDWSTWRIEAFDNTIKVFANAGTDSETLLIDFTDTGDTLPDGQNNGKQMYISSGAVGIGSAETDVCFDNITVRKMEDILGGDYDNSIDGNWDQPIPDYILEYPGNKY